MKKLSILLFVPAIALAHNVSSNIEILPLQKMPFSNELKAQMKTYNSTMEKKGFVSTDSEYPRHLLRMRFNKPNFKATTSAPADKELKKSISEIPLTFGYKSRVPNPIAYTGIGILNEKGYSGVKEFFDGKKLGVCTLSAFHIANVKQKIQLNEDGLRYDVNDKPTRISKEGNQNSGFLYSVKWYDANFARDLECATNTIDDSYQNEIIKLAKIIDKG